MKKFLSFLKYLKKCKVAFAFAIICGIAFGAVSGVGIPVIFQKFYKQVFEPVNGVKFPFSYVLMYGAILPGIFIVRGIFGFLNSYFMSFAAMVIMKEMRSDIFKRLQFMPMSFFDKNSHGDLIARMANDPIMVQNVLLQFASEVLKQPAQMIGGCVTLLYICIQNNNYLMLPLFAITVALAALPIRAVKKGLKAKGLQVQNMAGGIFQQISENLDAAAEVRSFNLQKSEIEKHNKYLEFMKTMGLHLVKYQKMQQPVVEFFSALVISTAFLYAYYIGMPFSAFSALAIALYFTTDPLKRLGNLMADMHIAEGAIDRIKYILDMPLHIADPKNPTPVDRLEGKIEFRAVHFAYTDTPTLKNINVEIPKGKKIALVGHSGAGKSTFVKLVSRFYDVNSGEGEILIDGINIKDMLLEDLRRNIAIVPQYPVLFNDTILSNIGLGNAEASEDQIFQAAQNALAHDFITEFPRGYQTHVGERGDLLSGGQKQRIAIARAFLKNAPILIFDEATSSLDSDSEFFIQQALNKLSEGKTVITIAHRLSTIKNADMILVFAHGEIVASGTHEELLQRSALYQNFVRKQNLHIQEVPSETPEPSLAIA